MTEGLFYSVDMDSFNNIVGFNECKWRGGGIEFGGLGIEPESRGVRKGPL